jgi:DNA-binding NarL/FixJ family response regulator
MAALSAAEYSRVQELSEQLDLIRLDRASSLDDLLPEIRDVLAADSLLVLSPVQRPAGWDVERFHHVGFDVGSAFRRRFVSFLDTAPKRFAWYDAARPEREQRNRVIDAIDIIHPGEYEASQIYTAVMQPTGLHRHRQPRVLVCDGPSLLAWFGAFHSERFTVRQQRLLAMFVPALRRRLRVERQMQVEPRARVILETVLETFGAPAFVLDARARILESSRAGRALIELARDDVATALRDALAGRPNRMAIELTPIVARGTPVCWLAIVRAGSAEARIANAVAQAVARWALTTRQRAVLELVLRGHSTTTIAAELAVSERAIQHHLTALYDRIGVDSRTALIASVLGS